MPSAKPSRPPAFDDKTFSQRLWERVRTLTGGQYSVFKPLNDGGEKINFPRFIDWVRNLRNVVNTNAVMLDDVKDDVDDLRKTSTVKLSNHESRLDALEAAKPPFFSAHG